MSFFIYLCTRNQLNIYHDRNHCKAQFRVCPQDRYMLRADTFGGYPTDIVGGGRAFGGGS